MDILNQYGIFNSYPDYANLTNTIIALKKQYPFLKVVEIGKSVSGRNIYALQLGQWSEKVLFVGGFNGFDYSTTTLLMAYVIRLCCAMDEGLCMADVDILRAFLGRGLVVIPCINPDGCEIALHKEESDKQIISYESKILKGLCSSIDFRHILQLEIGEPSISYKFGLSTPTKATLMGQILSAISTIPLNMAQENDMDSFAYWFTNQFKKPAFKISVGNNIPVPPIILPFIYDSIEELLTIGAIL